MKTFQDFENLRNKKCAPFDNMQNYLIEWMADAYVAKLDGCRGSRATSAIKTTMPR